jgi:5-methyltetrahydropteroyltriglutamate--homocysteine methyltransferase
MINPDCGLRHLPADVARAKLRAMVAGAAEVRREQRPGGADAAPPGHRHKTPIRNKAGTGR